MIGLSFKDKENPPPKVEIIEPPNTKSLAGKFLWEIDFIFMEIVSPDIPEKPKAIRRRAKCKSNRLKELL